MSNGDEIASVLNPVRTHPQRRYVDFAFGLDYLSVNSPLLRLMHGAMSERGLSCLLVNASNSERLLGEARRGRFAPLIYLDLCARPGAAFAALLRALAERGTRTFTDPTLYDWTVKEFSHPRLERAGLPLPRTVIIGPQEADRELTADERALVGERCVIKPSYGVAGMGAVIGISPDREQIARAREFNRADHWLIQRMIQWGRLGGREAYLRGYNVLGHRTLMWWSNERGYARVTWEDLKQYDLLGAVELVDRVAAVTGMPFFSSEIAITGESGTGRYCLIDYVNDQCDIDPEAAPDRSPPASWVKWVCGRFAEFTWRVKFGLPVEGEGTLSLADER
jgi:hypothetical protein